MIDSVSDPLEKTARKNGAGNQSTLDGMRLPPHDIPMEMGVIGCCLLAPQECVGQLRLRMKLDAHKLFYDLRHQTIAGVLLAMDDEQVPIDLITVQERLKRIEMLEPVGGIAYLSELQDRVPSAANMDYYLAKVRDKFLLRQLIQTCSGIVGKVFDYEGDAEKLALECEAQIAKLTETEALQTEQHIRVVMQGVIQDMEDWHYTRGSSQLRGLPTGPAGQYLDKVLLGIRDTHYVTLAGRPGEGKSSFAMNLVEYLAADYVWRRPTGKKVLNAEQAEVDETEEMKGIPVAVFTIEMDNESLGYRLLFGRAGVSEAKFNQGFSPKGTQEKLAQAASQLAATNIWLDDSTGQTINQIAAKARRMAKQHGIKLFVLDYLQLCVSDNPRDEERIKLDKISKKIMALKKQLKVPWLVLAQLNRNIETDGRGRDRQPLLSDLAGSGAIEQDSDKVIIIRKTPRKETEEEDEAGVSDKSVIERVCADWPWDEKPTRMDLWVVKNRRGPRGHAQFIFQNNLCRFEDWHLWKVRHGVEARKAGESKHLGAGTQDEFADAAASAERDFAQ
jgi:replicative DNA helicase